MESPTGAGVSGFEITFGRESNADGGIQVASEPLAVQPPSRRRYFLTCVPTF
jgi:hypothetical protein